MNKKLKLTLGALSLAMSCSFVSSQIIKHASISTVKKGLLEDSEDLGKHLNDIRLTTQSAALVEKAMVEIVEQQVKIKTPDSLDKKSKDVFEKNKSELLTPERKAFLDLLHSYKFVLKTIVEESLVTEDGIDVKDSILIKFLAAKKDEVSDFFENAIKTPADLLEVSKSVKRVGLDLLDSLLKDKDDMQHTKKFLIAYKKYQAELVAKSSNEKEVAKKDKK